MTVERTVTNGAADPNPGRVDRSRLGKLNPADTEPRPPIPPEDIEATRAELAELRCRMTRAGEQPPSRVHTGAELAARAAGKRQRAPDAPGRDDRA